MLYNRNHAVEYGEKWAFSRNTAYYSFDKIGGDCTNFISQCLYAGCHIMNYTPEIGWYYVSASKRSASWTGVEYLYNFLTKNTGKGPYGTLLPLRYAQIGDVIQLSFDGNSFSHSLLVTEIGDSKNLDSILVTTHTFNAYNRPLNSYIYNKLRLIHIQDARI